MRRVLLALTVACALWALEWNAIEPRLFAAVARVKSGEGSPTAALTNINDVLVVVLQWNTGATITLSSISGDKCSPTTMTLKNNSVLDTTNNFRAAYGYCLIGTAAANTFTPTWVGGTPSQFNWSWIEISGVDTVTPFDASEMQYFNAAGAAPGTNGVTSGAGQTVTSGSFVWSTGGDLNSAGHLQGAAGSAGTAFTRDITATTAGRADTEWLVKGATGSQQGQWSSTDAFMDLLVGMIAFKASAGAAVTPRCTLLGVCP
jgi:hypothetical protein